MTAASNYAKGPGATWHGDGSPVGVLVAPAGSTYQANDGGYFFKSSGGLPYSDGSDWTSTGWLAVGGGGGQPITGASLHIDGTTNTYLSTPAPAFTPTTGLAMYWVGAPDDFTSGVTQTLIASTGFGTTDRSRQLVLSATGKLAFTYSTDGATNTTVTQATNIPGATDGSVIGLGLTFLFNNGSGGGTVTWYTSTDLGATWVSFGTPTTTTGTTAVHSTNKATTIGLTTALSQPFVGTVVTAWELNAVAGTRLDSVDYTGHWTGTDVQGNAWTLNGSSYYWVAPAAGAGSYDALGAAAAAQAAAIAASNQRASNLSDVASAATSRTNLGLGTAATQATGAFDAAGAAATAQAAAVVTANAYTDTRVALYAVKTADTLLAQSSIVQVADPDLHVAVAASTTYHLEAFIIYDASVTADINFGWTNPTGATMTWNVDGLKTGATTVTDSGTHSTTTITLKMGAGGVAVGTNMCCTLRGTLVVSTTAGTLTLTDSQGTSEATQVTVHAGSWLRLQKIV